MREIEACLKEFDELEQEAGRLVAELRRAARADELETCRLCHRRWLAVRATIRLLNQHVERCLLFRLPPARRDWGRGLGH